MNTINKKFFSVGLLVVTMELMSAASTQPSVFDATTTPSPAAMAALAGTSVQQNAPPTTQPMQQSESGIVVSMQPSQTQSTALSQQNQMPPPMNQPLTATAPTMSQTPAAPVKTITELTVPKPAFVTSLTDNIIPTPEEFNVIAVWRETEPLRKELEPHIAALFNIIHEAGINKELIKAKLTEKLLEVKMHAIHILDVLTSRKEVVNALMNKINSMPKVRDFIVEKFGQMGITKEMLSNPQNVYTYLENLKNVANEAYAWLENKKGQQRGLMPAIKPAKIEQSVAKTTA